MGKRIDDLIRDEEGVTTAGMAVSLMVSLALLFSGAQLYRVGSASAEIQEVADACALAAENQVAEFEIAVAACDATVLTMTLFSATLYGLGVVCACVPPAAPLAEGLLQAASKAVDARDSFSDAAVSGLDKLQKMLPFLAAASALNVAHANNAGAMQADYQAVGMLLPQTGRVESGASDAALNDVRQSVDASIGDIKEAAAAAEDAARTMGEAKKAAFDADCGINPGRCMYERARSLSGIPDEDNPLYSSVDTWSFGVALKRAKAYYRARIDTEPYPAGNAAEEASYNLRMRFYRYALDRLGEGYVLEGAGSFSAVFPSLFENTAEMRETSLYTEAAYPVSGNVDGTDGIMHAYDGCPAIDEIQLYDSIQALDAEVYVGCSVCGFSVESLGNVASATTSTPVGFEHYYKKVRIAADEYERAQAELGPMADEVKDRVEPIMDKISGIVADVANHRIKAVPPGSSGAVAMVVNTRSNRADTGFESAFVRGGTTLGTRAAVSGATLLEDASDESATVISSLLDGFDRGNVGSFGAERTVLKVWSAILVAYQNGQGALLDAVRKGLDSFPTNTQSGLGKWAGDTLVGAIDSVGLAPADIWAKKAVVINTGHVAGASDEGFSARFMTVKDRALSMSSPTTDPFAGMIGHAGDALREAVPSGEVTIAEIRFPIGESSIPLTICIPESVSNRAGSMIDKCIDAVTNAAASVTGVKVWQ